MYIKISKEIVISLNYYNIIYDKNNRRVLFVNIIRGIEEYVLPDMTQENFDAIIKHIFANQNQKYVELV